MAVGVVLVSIGIVELTDMRPEYDAYGWLVWGQQALHGDLSTASAPSFKPLPFLFTLPFALTGRAQVWLWMVTAVSAALAGAVIAGHLAHRLTGPCPSRSPAPSVAGVFAGLGVLGISTYWHFILISNTDPMIVALCLGAIDCHLSRRYRWAFWLLVLAGLGRPEAWPLIVINAAWAWRVVPSMRGQLVGGMLVVAALSFGIPALTSHSWLSPGQFAEGSVNALHSDRFWGVIERFAHLYEWPMQVAVLVGIALAAVQGDRRGLLLTGAAGVWVATEIAFAYHGWSAVPRYLFEPAAVLIVVAAVGVGQLLAAAASHRAELWSMSLRTAVVWAGCAWLLVLLVALVPVLQRRARFAHGEIDYSHSFATQVDRLHDVITRDGGATRLRSCGQPVTSLQFQTVLAWDIGTNVGGVGWQPTARIRSGRPIVLFQPSGTGWVVRPIHIAAADRVRCDRLATTLPS